MALRNTLREKTGARFFITNSRRTTDAVTAKFREILRPPVEGPNHDVFVDWKLAAEARAAYIQYLAEADYLVVTGDSMSMIADGLTTGKPTYVFAPAGSLEDRHKAFVLEQAKRGRLRPLGTRRERFAYEPLDASKAIASSLRSRWGPTLPVSPHTCQRLFYPGR